MSTKTTVAIADGDTWDVHVEDSGEGAACIFDGTYGWHNIYRVVDLAVDHGWGLSDDDKTDLAEYKSGESGDPEVGEHVHNLAEYAEQYLNDKLVTVGWQFGWHEGEFFLANTAWWEAQ